MDADDESSGSQGTDSDGARTEYVREKLHGKRPADEVPSMKRRKIARPSQGQEGLVSIAAFAQP